MSVWSNWNSIPSPQTCFNIEAPVGPGVYQVREKRTHRLIQFGIGVKCQKRMQSLYPPPFGSGTRNNSDKREYILTNWKDLEYRTVSTNTRAEAALIERVLKSDNNHLFNT